MTSDEKHLVETPSSGWHEIASGDIGDILYWQPGYEVLEDAEVAIGLLETLDTDEIAWDELIRGLPRFAFLPELLQRRSFGFTAWEAVDGFFVREGDRNEETGSMSGEWTHMWLSMNHDEKTEMFHDFEELTRRLNEYPPFADVV